MNHLLIWEEIPDRTLAYILVPGQDDAMIELAKQAHGYYMNGEDNEAINTLNGLLYSDPPNTPSREEDYNSQNHGRQQISGGPFAAVYICGFML